MPRPSGRGILALVRNTGAERARIAPASRSRRVSYIRCGVATLALALTYDA
jgi:hypothetical protein